MTANESGSHKKEIRKSDAAIETTRQLEVVSSFFSLYTAKRTNILPNMDELQIAIPRVISTANVSGLLDHKLSNSSVFAVLFIVEKNARLHKN